MPIKSTREAAFPKNCHQILLPPLQITHKFPQLSIINPQILYTIQNKNRKSMALICFIEVLNTNREMSAEEFKAWLRRFDFDGDGRISREELKEALRSLHTWFGWWKARQGMIAVDSNRNGQIDGAKEIENLVIYAQKQLHMKIYDENDYYR